jgi:hypothetical protein
VISHLSFFNLSISPNLFTSLISQLPERLTSKEADGLVKILHKCDDYRARREIIRKLGKEVRRKENYKGRIYGRMKGAECMRTWGGGQKRTNENLP